MQQPTTVVLLKKNTWSYRQAKLQACPETPSKDWSGVVVGSFFTVDTQAYENGQIKAPAC